MTPLHAALLESQGLRTVALSTGGVRQQLRTKLPAKNLYEGNHLTSAPEIIPVPSFSSMAQSWDDSHFPQRHPRHQGNWQVQELETLVI